MPSEPRLGRECRRTVSNNPSYLSRRERLFDGLRKAGVPEG